MQRCRGAANVVLAVETLRRRGQGGAESRQAAHVRVRAAAQGLPQRRAQARGHGGHRKGLNEEVIFNVAAWYASTSIEADVPR
jgi:hypothetical protein